MLMINKYPCPCCDYRTLNEEPPGTYLICPVCYWEDDEVQFYNIDYVGGANAVSLSQARKNFSEFGAVTLEAKRYVRQPSPLEKPALPEGYE